jgi:thiol-disulfide isomerase/thioredoxin
MINKIIFIALLISSILPAQNENLSGETINKIVKDTVSGMPMLIGYCTREAFKDTNFVWWWMSEYDLYNIDSTLLNEIKNDLQNVNIRLVMGTWCSDSRREVPRFFKILDAVNYPSDEVEIICVDEDKHTEGDELAGLNIELVPTIIFYKNGNELGRIVESPQETLEKDMVKILKSHS